MLSCEKGLLPGQPPPVARKAAAPPDDAMAGNDERYGVARAGMRNGANRRWPADRRRYLFICTRLAVRDSGERIPDLPLKRRRLDVERQIEPRTASPEMPDDLHGPLLQPGMIGHARRGGVLRREFPLEIRV